MKRIGYLYPAIIDLENIKLAAQKASRGKRHHRSVSKVMDDLDRYALKIQAMLKDKTYVPCRYSTMQIKDGATKKVREIKKPKFYPDQIIHWALMLQIEPILMRGMYHYNCGSIPGKGASHGQNAIKRWLRDSKNTKYCFKMDVSKYYPSIKNDIIKQQFRRLLKDNDTLQLIDVIIDSSDGLPIGNYTSGWLANLHLTPLDHAIKKLPGVVYYVRYVDDLVLFGPNKRKLHKARLEIAKMLAELQLTIKGNWQVFKTDSRPVDFLGLRFYRYHTTLRRRNALRIKRRCRKIGAKNNLSVKDARSMLSYWGWIKRTDSFDFYKNHVKPHVKIRQCRKVVSKFGQTNNQTRCT